MGSPLYQIVANICVCFRAVHSVELLANIIAMWSNYLCELIPQRLIYCLLIESKHQFYKKGELS